MGKILVALMVFVATAVTGLAQEKVVIYGDHAYPPYSYDDNGTPAGIYVEILTEVFQKIPGYALEIRMVPWARGINFVKTGKAVALFPPLRTDARVPWMQFPEPIFQEKVVVFGKKSKLMERVRWPEDFYGTTIGINSGWSLEGMGGKALAKAVKEGKIKVHEAKTAEMHMKMIMADRTDFYINDIMSDTSRFQGGDPIVAGPVASTNFSYLGFTRKIGRFPYIPDLIDQFKREMKEMKASGRVDEIVNRYKK
ncbi:MAG: amino acid ABC transporter substrate-binding protein [Desulfobacteraceae bacterium]|nr:amino acid ABC transporter substrate-binding protein [Desulfobacteraceae bacterium]